MKSQEVLSYTPLLLKQEQREFYFKNGYLYLENFVNKDILKNLKRVTHNFVEESKELTESDTLFDVAPEHSNQHLLLSR